MRQLSTLLFLPCILLLGCMKTEDKIINKETIADDYHKLIKIRKLTGKQDTVINTLVKLSKGRSEYIKYIGLNDDGSKLLVDDKEFISSTSRLFEGLGSSKITYGHLLNEVLNFEEEEKRILIAEDSIFKIIDLECASKQNELDSINLLLNGMVDFKINNIGKYNKDYRDYGAVSLIAINKTAKPIEAISFSVTFYDKLDEEITTIHCSSSTTFSKVTTMLFEYDAYDNDQREVFKALIQTTRDRVGRIEKTIRKINLNGGIIGRDQINFKYVSPKILSGYCPYLDASNELKMSIELLDLRKKELIFKYSSLNLISETTNSIISLDNYKKSMLDVLRGK